MNGHVILLLAQRGYCRTGGSVSFTFSLQAKSFSARRKINSDFLAHDISST